MARRLRGDMGRSALCEEALEIAVEGVEELVHFGDIALS